MSIREEIVGQAIGSAQPHINKSIVDKTLLPIFSKEAQKKIISKIEHFLSKVKSVEENIKEIERLESEALKGYFYNSGKLFSSIFLGEFCSERRERIKKGWNGRPFIGVSKSTGISQLRLTGPSQKTSYEKYKIVRPGDFIYNPMRVDIGSIAIWDGDEIAVTSPDYVVFSINHTLSPLLLLKYLKSEIGLRQINNHTQGSVRSRLYFRNLSEIKIPFCGVDAQKEAQTILSGFAKMSDECQGVIFELNSIKSKVLNDAFNGIGMELTDQTAAGDLLIQKMQEEKDQYKSNESGKKNKDIMKVKVQTSAISFLDFVRDNYGKGKFTFPELLSTSGYEYETLKDEVYKHLESDLLLEFDATKETMFIKMKP